MGTIKLILQHKIDLALIALYTVAMVIGIRADAPSITNGACLFAIGNTMFNIMNKVKLVKSGVLDKLKEDV